MTHFGHASRDEEGRPPYGLSDMSREEIAERKERAEPVKDEINGQCDRLGIKAHLDGGMPLSAYVWELEKILLYLLVKADGDLDIYDGARIMALINPTEHERLLGSIKKYEDWQAAKRA